MKTRFKIFLLVILLLPDIKLSVAQSIPTYRLTGTNFNLITPDSLTFDIYLLHTNYPVTFEYAGAQYFLNFNPNFANGGILSFRILGTELQDCQPRNPSVTSGVLRFVSNAFPGPGLGCEISHTGIGTLVCKLSLRTTANFLPLDSFHIRWRNMAHGNPITKLFAYVNGINTEITDSNYHFIDLFTSIQEPNVSSVPDEFSLSQNYPNPFNPKTIINYELPITNYVLLKVYNVLGNEVKILVNEKQTAGSYSIEFDGSELSSGVYYYKLTADNFIQVRKMILKK